ncbi:hypothetical protein HMPREF1992_02117 [Selenomonas sp. oral taxon 892 str. F0426]|nr:hypothetical protein HMPREF1992_02117 [Selenomonas sp. oral taxon 892 str. F0426]
MQCVFIIERTVFGVQSAPSPDHERSHIMKQHRHKEAPPYK